MVRYVYLFIPFLLISCNKFAPTFNVGEPETIITKERLNEADINGIDASIYAINDGDNWKWFCTSRWKHVYSVGPRSDPFDSVVVRYGKFENLPDAYADTRVGFSYDHLWGNISWIANVYRNPADGYILSFAHIENASQKRGGVYFSLGLAISKDGGNTYQWCGNIIQPELSYDTWFKHWYPDSLYAGFIYPNTGLANYVVKDDYFYLYYTDTKNRTDTLINGVAIARARVEDVLKAADNYSTVEWKKYYNGRWEENTLWESKI
jgi:hypothetical protein